MRQFRIIHGNVDAALPTLEPCSFDACLCDPPYGLKFMGKAWDHGVPGVALWAEVLRCLKPGAYLFVFGGTRTFHRLACGIEDAGFELFDVGCYLYGSGFPKSHDLSKAIDKAAGAKREVTGLNPTYRKLQVSASAYNLERNPHLTAPATPEAVRWSGYGTALKPAWEPIIMARKPVERTYANNAVTHGCGGLNIDGCRIGTEHRRNEGMRSLGVMHDDSWKPRAVESVVTGRWPANVMLDSEAAALLDQMSGELASGNLEPHHKRGANLNCYGQDNGASPSRSFGGDSGGASRFFYTAKADSTERAIGGVTNNHPTVKPIDLCAWLAKLILPPERETPRRLIVPFSGSGSEIIGALRAGWDEAVGIEAESEWAALSQLRIAGDAPLLNMEADAGGVGVGHA